MSGPRQRDGTEWQKNSKENIESQKKEIPSQDSYDWKLDNPTTTRLQLIN